MVDKKETKTFNSFSDFQKFYFPNTYKENKEKKMTPEQRGRKMARQAIKDVVKNVDSKTC